ncbi:NADP-dependent malic enzyme [Nocardioides sp. YIM 152315]|uniref:NAD(P)-dependent malic enzyme n=1 Tax=Nocardioides sp. YIM 152315 TaxID=3031760 RepID=UPI0023DA14D2|nr:NADP-dependent malic enzyme [Nocardioides sp. YIM 152315]MDF1605791.1 NADP-dependent malic enzyme [Nocardioides sp. YIM 152315]
MAARVPGKIELVPTVQVKDHDDLARVYTPGVADDVRRVASDDSVLAQVTGVANRILVVTDGSAILGLGDVGPRAGLPVMEGKSALFKRLAGIDAWPLPLRSREIDDLVHTIADVSVAVSGINLEDVAAPRCFELTRRLQDELDVPVFHDDQHGTAIVVLAALRNALPLVDKELADASFVVSGAGAAGSCITRLLLAQGATRIVVCDSHGALHPGRDLEGEKAWLAEHTNPAGITGGLAEALDGADVLVGVSAPGLVDEAMLESMNVDPVLFGLANPDPEFDPRVAASCGRIVATGRSDLPNQINNVLAFPGVFRGLLDGPVRQVDTGLMARAADAIASLVDDPGPDSIMPDVFDSRLVDHVAAAVARRG